MHQILIEVYGETCMNESRMISKIVKVDDIKDKVHSERSKLFEDEEINCSNPFYENIRLI